MNMRHYNFVDKLIMQCERAIQTVFLPAKQTRENPGDVYPEIKLSESERKQLSGLMRVNHTGEVCAQALYYSQAWVAKDPNIENSMSQSAEEENDHLAWCESRLKNLNSHVSYLNPIWYGGSFVIGTVMGVISDTWSLGFIAETEKQVVAHLESHLNQLPEYDQKSRAILEQMQIDEDNHAIKAMETGGELLPWPMPSIMQSMAKVMTNIAYYL